MNVDLIKQAVRQFVGLHDFRNFCKKDKKDKNQIVFDDEQDSEE